MSLVATLMLKIVELREHDAERELGKTIVNKVDLSSPVALLRDNVPCVSETSLTSMYELGLDLTSLSEIASVLNC